jgi:hypothetical protein
MQNMETYRHQSYVSTSGRTWGAPELQGIEVQIYAICYTELQRYKGKTGCDIVRVVQEWRLSAVDFVSWLLLVGVKSTGQNIRGPVEINMSASQVGGHILCSMASGSYL